MTWTLAGRYRLTGSVSSGPTGELWRGVDSGTGHPVAVKLLHPPLATDSRVLDQLLRARRTLTALWYPGIARLVDVVITDRDVALVSDFGTGTDLARYLAGAGPLAPAQAARIAAAVAEALSAAHQAGVVHGDLKPANILVSPHGGDAVTVTDFSIATLLRPGQPAPDSSPYLPGWVRDGGMPTAATDLYSLGLVLRELLTGSTAPEASPIDPRLGELIDDCLGEHLATPPSAAELAHRLRELTPHLPRTAPAPGRPTTMAGRPGPSGRRATSRRPAGSGRRGRAGTGGHSRRVSAPLLFVAAALVAIAAAGVVVVANGFDRDRPAEEQVPPPQTATAAQAPAVPVEATENSREGGTAFVEYWFAALTHAVRTGETAPVSERVNPDCQQCQDAVATIDAVHARGGSLRGGAYVVRNVTAADLWSADRPVYDATVDRSPRTVSGASGFDDLPGLSFATCSVVLEWSPEGWSVREVITPDCVA